jgi:hypothetical protein
MRHRLTALALVFSAFLAGHSADAASDPPPAAQALQARYAALAASLAQSPFRRPLLLQSGSSTSAPHGEVYAVIDHPFGVVGTSLHSPDSWCALLILQTNIKRCAPAGSASDQRLQVAVARRYTDPVADAHPVEFRYDVQSAEGDYVSVDLAAGEGPVGTRNYRLRFEAVPIGARQTFVHLSYGYEAGFAARLATGAYLEIAGREKVGFSIVGRDAAGNPLYVRGIQGVAERNTMRYFLAIESFLATLSVPSTQRVEKRLRHFHASLEHYPAQLHETELTEYLEMKRREAQSG